MPILSQRLIDAASATVFGTAIINSTAGSTMIGPSDSAKVTILSSGNVGIGTGNTAPTEKLHVAGNLKVTGNIINPTLTGTVQLPATVTTPDGTVTFPFGGGTVVTATGTQTLTNKSIDAGQITGTVPVPKGGTGATSLTGILKGNGTGAFTAVTAPTGALVGTTDTQTLSNKTFTGPVQVNGDVAVSGRLSNAGSTASGVGAAAFGAAYAFGDYSVALSGGEANSAYSVAIGPESQAWSNNSVAIGWFATSTGEHSIAIGGGNAIGEQSVAILGHAMGMSSIGMSGGQAEGDYSIAVGSGTRASAYGQLAVGQCNIIQGNPTAWVATDDLFTIGNGTSDTARSNAFVVRKNGDTSIYGSLTVSGAVAFSTAPTVGAHALVTENQLSSYQSSTGSGAGLTDLNASALATGTISTAVLPAAVTQLGATVSLDDAETTGNLAWGRVDKTAASLADLPVREFSDLQNKPTTLEGYGITDGLNATTGIAVTRDASGRITSAIHIEPQGDISMGLFQ